MFQQASSTLGEFDILQAGSTVATSLSEGEADAKHCFMLEVVVCVVAFGEVVVLQFYDIAKPIIPLHAAYLLI